jgi:ferrous iron transport protein B
LARASYHIALLGNPNSGKTSLFNSITGLNQKVGNFPGVTVEKKSGTCTLPSNTDADILDLPGSYSLYPRRADEWVAYDALMNPTDAGRIDLVIVVADASNLRRNLLYVSQVIDIGRPVIVALTMMDLARKKGITVDIQRMESILSVPVVPVNPRKNTGMDILDKAISRVRSQQKVAPPASFIPVASMAPEAIGQIQEIFPAVSDYSAVHYLIHHESMDFPGETQERIESIEKNHGVNHTRIQAQDIQQRYHRISEVMKQAVREPSAENKKIFSEKLDRFFLHRTWGNLIMLAVLFLMFQSVFLLAEYPMNAIEWGFGELSAWLGRVLPEHWASNLLINGVVAGLGGILVFVPQIMILFGMITFLEDTGYMARISFLTDKVMRKAGLNGKSVMPMISGFACAVPAIMSARSIENRKERLLTILVTPFMSCSARLPVYTILIALVIPRKMILGFISVQGLVMMGLYLLGIVMALLASSVLNWIIRIREKSFFILELPIYRPPRWKNILLTMYQKAMVFVVDAGKVIMVISLLLWALSSFGPGEARAKLESDFAARIASDPANTKSYEAERNAAMLETSYAGIMGRKIEPLIEPLGFDWKIGIAIITSFAAREVFVGTMATLYSVEDSSTEDNSTLREKMQAAVRSDGKPVYTLATGVSLMIFYVLAMQCMSTLAVVKRETGTWKWPVIQFLFMTGLAYLLSMLAYQLLR